MEVFYNRLLCDDSINYIFIDVAKLDIKTHLPIIADFWESILLNKNVYKNNPMNIHLHLNDKTPLLKSHFDTWLAHFNKAIDELFEGKIALLAKQRALSVATLMQIKIMQKNKEKESFNTDN